MKVDIEKYSPVTITFETREELNLFYRLIVSHEAFRGNITSEINEFRDQIKKALNARLYL